MIGVWGSSVGGSSSTPVPGESSHSGIQEDVLVEESVAQPQKAAAAAAQGEQQQQWYQPPQSQYEALFPMPE
ncbi:hypothetical protein Taro_016640 [Colocasia esculenta]|uniref:Uncharacterized protein n=1 Tax=Colocasia esculenta TaxID=4460 RepID=A0A843UWW6_COLES|nr:hypothetical protein [Colocasia esculenta]